MQKIIGELQYKKCPICKDLDKPNPECDMCWGEGKIELPYWKCESCGHINYLKKMPASRDYFYAKVEEKGSPICPRCKSESFMPVGY